MGGIYIWGTKTAAVPPSPFVHQKNSKFNSANDGSVFLSLCHGGQRQYGCDYQASVSPLHGSDHMFVFHGVWLDDKYRKQGYGDLLHRWRVAIVQEALNESESFDKCALLAMVRDTNAPEQAVMRKHMWELIRSFDGLEMYTKTLTRGDAVEVFPKPVVYHGPIINGVPR